MPFFDSDEATALRMIPPEKDIENRRVVWRGLADLFLDNELQDTDISAIARTLAKSTYTLAEIESMLYREVYPVCIENLRSVAGEWSGFDDQWLEDSILKHAKRNWAISNSVQPNRWMIREEWERVKSEYAELE